MPNAAGGASSDLLSNTRMLVPQEPPRFISAREQPVTIQVRIELPNVKVRREFLEAVAEILRLTTQAEDWDSYGGRPTSLRSATTAIQVLASLTPLDLPEPQILPTTDGGVQLEWHRGGVDLEVEISSNRVSYWYENATTGETREEELLSDYASLADLDLALL